jgi:hypothetical protein
MLPIPENLVRLGPLDIAIPPDWEDRSLYTFIAPPQEMRAGMMATTQSFRANVVLTRRPVPPDQTIEASAELAAARAKRDLGDIKVTILEGPPIDGSPSQTLSYVVVDPRGGPPIAQVQYLFKRDGSEWSLTFSVAALELKNRQAELERLVMSIHFPELR